MRVTIKLSSIILAFQIIWILGCPFTYAKKVPPVYTIQKYIEISRLAADSEGHTYFFTDKVEWMHWFVSGRRTMETKAVGLQFYHIKKSLSMGFHPAPRKQYLLILRGTLQIEASSGEKKEFSPGAIVLVEDIKGTRGHISRVMGNEDVFAAVIPVP